MRPLISVIIIALAILSLIGYGWAIVTLAIWAIFAQIVLLIEISKD